MELKDTVTMFSTEVFADAFDPLTIFFGKINPFAEVANSGSSSQRRILETPVDQVLPVSHVIQSLGKEKYIVADVNPDYWNNEEIRYKYSILPVDTMGTAGDIGTVLADSQPDKELYGYPYFVRREIDDSERSDYLSGYEVYFPKTKFFSRSTVVLLEGNYYRLKTDTWVDGAGYSVAQAVKIENPLQVFEITVMSPVYDPVNDEYAPSAIPGVSCFVEPMREDYEFVTPSFTEIRAGDKAISVLKVDAVLAVNDTIGSFKIQSIRDMGDWVTCQCTNSK